MKCDNDSLSFPLYIMRGQVSIQLETNDADLFNDVLVT